MKKPIAILAMALLTATSAQAAKTEKIRILRVIDGDTVLIDKAGSKRHLHLYGIDAPEPGQRYAEEAKDLLLETLLKNEYQIEEKEVPKSMQRYCVIQFQEDPNGPLRDMACLLLYEGLAYFDKELNSKRKDMDIHANSQKMGKAGNRGVWSGSERERPWDYRDRRHIAEIEMDEAVRFAQKIDSALASRKSQSELNWMKDFASKAFED